ncbi:MAG: K+/H+ antiporter [Bdellovibrionales bacterium RIFOXYC1_FULL_54_43]|nr:MAG: K+/H+ antiporter [Bdellovibrionales bacterium RIFOXYC1_FULL_54_43]OFZ80160.1 MAG: K+/H+ antiporter [Bdellovibrionales bacterium RIFOXYD1_FULL_55_31]
MSSIEYLILGGAILLFFSVIASKASGKLGIPALLLFLAVGMLAGSDGIGKIYFDDPYLAEALGTVALAFILFSGGLNTEWSEVRPVIRSGILLSTIGVLVTCILTGAFATAVLQLSVLEGLLLGAIMSSTDAAAVFSVLRSKRVSLKGEIKPLLELESGSNDPMAVFLTVGLLLLLGQQEVSAVRLVPMFFQQMILGTVLGFLSSKSIKRLLNGIRLEYDGLYPVFTISCVLIVFSLTQVVGGNGFLAVYVSGLILGRENFVHKRSLTLFHDGLAWLMQISMFLTLGLLVFPSRLPAVMVPGLAISAFLILVGRPAGVFLTLIGSGYQFKEKLMVSWVGLRGAVPIILATYPLLAGIAKADTIFHIVFFIVLTSTLLQGTSIPYVARWLGVDAPLKEKFRYPLQYVPAADVKNDLVELEISPNSPVVGKTIIEVAIPKDALIVLLQRKGDVFVPRGGTRFEANDTILVLSDRSALEQVRRIVSGGV